MILRVDLSKNIGVYTPVYIFCNLMQHVNPEETSAFVAEKGNTVTFKVLQSASKPEIKAAVELLFKVEVAGVTVANIKGKTKRFGRFTGRRDHVRKAYVTLKPGQELDLGGEAV